MIKDLPETHRFRHLEATKSKVHNNTKRTAFHDITGPIEPHTNLREIV